MTTVYFVRHAQPDIAHADDRTRPLTALGWADSEAVADILSERPIDTILSSPYRRSMDTLRATAGRLGLPIHTDERFREREKGPGGHDLPMIRRRWDDFAFLEPGGECLADVQRRNVEALLEALDRYEGQTLALGTHGTALSTISHHFTPALGYAEFLRIWHSLPYVLRMDFEGKRLRSREDMLMVMRGY